jgi:hypothetical protein
VKQPPGLIGDHEKQQFDRGALENAITSDDGVRNLLQNG